MIKKITAVIMALAISVSCIFSASAYAPVDTGVQPMNSDQLASYSVSLVQGSASGQITIAYKVRGTDTMVKIGIFRIKIYTSSGSLVASISGSTSNGLLSANSLYASGSYSYQGSSGKSYYAVVTVYAYDGTAASLRMVTTSTVTAP